MTDEDTVDGDYTELRENVMEQSLVPVIEPPVALDVFRGIAEIDMTESERVILEAPADEDDIDVRPDGLIYLSHMRIRERFSKAFGPGKWSLMPVSAIRIKDNLAVRDWVMFIKGKFFSYAIGEAAYNPKNKMMTWGDVLETMKSNALSRLAKDIPIAPELWSRRYVYQFQQKHCVKVSYIAWNGATTGWRRVDSPPFDKETGICEDSPNKDRYIRPASAQKSPPKNQPTETPKKTEPPKSESKDNGHKDPVEVTEDATLITVWNGTQKPPQDLLSGKASEAFMKAFVTSKENVGEHLFNSKAYLTNHLRSHFKVDTLQEMTYEKVMACLRHMKKESDDARWYAEKETPKAEPDKPDVVEDSVAADATSTVGDDPIYVQGDRIETFGVDLDKVAFAAFVVAKFNELDATQKEKIVSALNFVKTGVITADNVKQLAELVKLG